MYSIYKFSRQYKFDENIKPRIKSILYVNKTVDHRIFIHYTKFFINKRTLRSYTLENLKVLDDYATLGVKPFD